MSRESGTTPETTGPKERGTPPRQRDPRSTLYIRDNFVNFVLVFFEFIYINNDDNVIYFDNELLISKYNNYK